MIFIILFNHWFGYYVKEVSNILLLGWPVNYGRDA